MGFVCIKCGKDIQDRAYMPMVHVHDYWLNKEDGWECSEKCHEYRRQRKIFCGECVKDAPDNGDKDMRCRHVMTFIGTDPDNPGWICSECVDCYDLIMTYDPAGCERFKSEDSDKK